MSKVKLILLFVSLGIMQGCVEQPKFTEEEKRIARPMNNNTYFSDGFKKLNRLLAIYNQPKYRLQVKTIENMSSAKQAMPSDSRGFIRTPLIRYMTNLQLVAYEPIFNKFETKTTGFVFFPEMKKSMPELVINGGVTQFDKGKISTSDNFDIDAEFGGGKGDTDVRYDNDKSDDLSSIALDLNMFKYKDRTYLSEVATQNKIEIHRKRKKNRFGLFLNGSGIGYSKYTTMQQSKDEALRILSEYSLLQLLGRLYDVPYWKCTIPNMPVDMDLVEKKVALFNSSKKEIKIKRIERLIKFYGYNVTMNGAFSKNELLQLKKIYEEYHFKATKILSSGFYQELYINAPIFKENIEWREKQKREKLVKLAKEKAEKEKTQEKQKSVDELFNL